MRRQLRRRSALAACVAVVLVGGAWSAAAQPIDEGAWGWGYNYNGEVGDGTAGRINSAHIMRKTPVHVNLADVIAVSAGNGHALALTSNGTVWGWGHNLYGQLGQGNSVEFYQSPIQVKVVTGVVAISAGADYGLALKSDGTVWAWGRNQFGQLGDGSKSNSRYSAVQVSGLTGVVAVAGGSHHSMALTSDGTVWAWGYNGQGALGDGTYNEHLTPAPVPGLTGVVAIAAGPGVSAAVKGDGTLWTWGYNYWGQLGNGSTAYDGQTTPAQVTSLTNVWTVDFGEDHAVALTHQARVYTWGYNDHGELGTGQYHYAPMEVESLSPAVMASAGHHHTLVGRADGTVWAFGDNSQGQLGDNTQTQRSTPVQVSTLGHVAQISAATYHSHALVSHKPSLVEVMDGDCGSTGGGMQVQLHGHALDGATEVLVGGVPATSFTENGGALDVVVPPHAAGWVGVSVTTPYGTATLASACRYTNYATHVGLGFDPDLATDIAVYRPSTGQWFVLGSDSGFDPGSSRVMTFGQAGDLPLRGDFDGDGQRDIAVYRPATGTWFWLKSSTNNTEMDFKGWGIQAQGDVPVSGDFDGDGKTDPTVYRPAYGTWFVLKSSSNYTQYVAYGWGAVDDTLVPADYDGDGTTDIAVYKAGTGDWYVRYSSLGFDAGQALVVKFGQTGDLPVDGDFDGDGKRDIAVYRPSTGTWFWLESSTNNTTFAFRGFGMEVHGDVPVPGDYDGDGKTDLCVYRAKYGTWFILWSSQNYAAYAAYGWGDPTDVPLGGAK